MPSLPDIPGKSLVSGGGRRAGKLAVGSALAVIAVGGYVARRIVRRGGGGEEGAVVTADPIAQTPTAPPDVTDAEVNGGDPSAAEAKSTAEEKADATAEKPLAAPDPPEPESPVTEAIKPADAPAAQDPTGTDTAPESASESDSPDAPADGEPTGTDVAPGPGDSIEPAVAAEPKDPHHALNNRAADPDPTEWPDPYDKRSDPLDPPDPDGEPFGAEPHVPTGAESTSEPHHDQNPEAGDRGNAPKPER